MSGMTTPVLDAPIFARPSSLRPETTERRFAWAAPAGWAMCALAGVATVAAAVFGRVSFLGTAFVLVILSGSTPILRR